MGTANPRVNVLLDEQLFGLIRKMALHDNMSISMKARELIELAISHYEDLYWVEKAIEREKSFKKSKALSHKETWS